MSELSPGQRNALLRSCYQNPWRFCKVFLPHWFRSEPSWYHLGLLAMLTRRISWLEELDEALLEKIFKHFVWTDAFGKEWPIFFRDSEGKICMYLTRLVMVMVPRGFAKTTVVSAAKLYNALYLEAKLQVGISETASLANMHLKNVKTELEVNEKIQLVFGIQKPDQRSGKTWSEDFIQLNNGTAIVARGRGAQVRGLNVGSQRPDRLYLDDVEDEESVKTAEQRKKTLDWLYGAVIPAMEEFDPNVFMALIGTLLHRESMLQVMREDPEVNTVVLEAIDRDGDMLWEALMPRSKYDERKGLFARRHKLGIFYMEYHNALRSEEEALFKPEFFIYGVEEDVVRALAIDPAISDKPDASMCAFAVVGMSEKGIITVRFVDGEEGMSPRDQIDTYFDLSKAYGCQEHGVESIAYQRALIHLLQEEMFRREHYFEIQPITHGQVAKEERIKGVLQPRYAAGYMRHAKRFMRFEGSLLDFPNGKLDEPDVVAMAVTLLDPAAGLALEQKLEAAQGLGGDGKVVSLRRRRRREGQLEPWQRAV